MMCIHIHFQEKKYFRKKTAEITRFDGTTFSQIKSRVPVPLSSSGFKSNSVMVKNDVLACRYNNLLPIL